ncbi:chloramphenicol phosphotransferase CPT family protein [Streptomyces rhizosphaerihabitans]|uniref:chloramphenicol phosphotransferase CPT family protein n=1 Tax=Streptomyces rhizosphaerihabitans TaxID=1266770 RepID=UPI0021BED3D2|nr:chloramphenicol phosphotransferase CPT family protein [Streptomyces rhizosphaerihabitans]MCT9008750.1 chloramphenicol phosphotransferase CPT family protein [Streptomyces rhizosphaerihabitans]
MAPGTAAQTADPAHARIPGTASGGTVILLNGTSSSGKTSIARALLDLLDGTWFHMPVDAFHAMRGGRGGREMSDEDLQAEIDRTAKGFHRAVAGMAAGGNNLVVDHPLSRRWRLLDLLDLLVPEDTVLVGVRCPLPELERRELERGDRQPGLAALQYSQVHSHGLHDLDVDTSLSSAEDCAQHIRDFLSDRPRPTAFDTLRRTLRQPK